MVQRVLSSIVVLLAICNTAFADSCYVQINYNKMVFNHPVDIDSLFKTIKVDTVKIVRLKNIKGFTQLNFNEYPKLWRLEVGFDSITEVNDWKLQSNAQEIFISGIKLNNLIIGECGELNSLHIGRCTIKQSFVFHAEDSIDDFSITGCDLIETRKFDVSKVKRVDLYNNKMKVLPEFVFSPIIYRVDLSGNKFTEKFDYKRLVSKKGLRILFVKKRDYTPEELNEIKQLAKTHNVKLI